MKFNTSVANTLKRDYPAYHFVRMFRNSWLVHLWSPANPQSTGCGLKISGRVGIARSGSGSVCTQCEVYLEDLGFTWPGARPQGLPASMATGTHRGRLPKPKQEEVERWETAQGTQMLML